MINVIIANHLNKQNAVWVQSGNDFVDLLYSFLTMPLGTIVRLLDNHGRSRQKLVIGCLNNLYKSVVDMSTRRQPSPMYFQRKSCGEFF